MLNVFESPWLILAGSVVLFMVMGTWRSVFPEKRHRLQMAAPILLALCAILLDVLVATDREQIERIIKTLHASTQEENLDAFAELIAPDYRDPLHTSRQQLLDKLLSWISRSKVQKARKIGRTWERLDASDARVSFRSGVVFDKDSAIARTYKQQYLTRVRLHLKKQPNRRWLIQEIELIQVDGQSFSWRQLPPIP